LRTSRAFSARSAWSSPAPGTVRERSAGISQYVAHAL
jgi:hypothetical protein